MNIENESLTEKYFSKIIKIYKTKETSHVSEDNIGIISRILLKLDYFIKLEKIIGYKGIELLVKQMKLREYKKEQYIYGIGEENQHFHLILKGEVDVFNYESNQRETQIKVATLKQGNIFGDYFTTSKKKTNSAIICSTDTITAQISHREIMNILSDTDLNTIERCNEVLKNFEIFKDLTRSSLERFYLCMEKKKFKRGDVVISEGDEFENDGIYFIYNGEFMITKSYKKIKNKLQSLDKEINSLEKEANVLLTCLRGYNPNSALIKSLYEKENKPILEINKRFTKKMNNTVKILIIKENEFFGDIEFFDETNDYSNKRIVSVTCCSDYGTVYYSPIQKFGKHLTQTIKDRIKKIVAERKRILNKRYDDALKGHNIFKESKKLKLISFDINTKNKTTSSKDKKFQDFNLIKSPQINKTENNLIDDVFDYKNCLNLIRQKRFKLVKMDGYFREIPKKQKFQKFLDSADKKSSKELSMNTIQTSDYYYNSVNEFDIKKRISILNSSSKDFSGVLNIPRIKLNGNYMRVNNVSSKSSTKKIGKSIKNLDSN